MTNSFGQAVRERRLELGKSLRGSAREMDISAATLSRVERDDNLVDIYLYTAVEIARHFNMSLDALTGLDKGVTRT